MTARPEPLPQPRQFGFARPTAAPSARPSLRRSTTRPAPSRAPQECPTPEHESNVPEELSELADKLMYELSSCNFKNLCVKHRGRCELAQMRVDDHPAAELINHLRLHGAPVTLTKSNTPDRLQAQIDFGCHTSARQEAAFSRQELQAQAAAGPNLVLPFSAVCDLPGLWLTPTCSYSTA